MSNTVSTWMNGMTIHDLEERLVHITSELEQEFQGLILHFIVLFYGQIGS